MSPKAPKSERELALRIAAWERELRDLNSLDPCTELPEKMKMGALIMMLTPGIKETIEMKLRRLTTYEALRREIMDYALRKRRDYVQQCNPNDMDINAVQPGAGGGGGPKCTQGCDDRGPSCQGTQCDREYTEAET